MPRAKRDVSANGPRRKYKGDLGRPFKMPVVQRMKNLSAAGTNEVEKLKIEALFNAEYEKEIDRRMGLLLDEYNISRKDNDRWFQLAEALAFDHVPGFDFTHELDAIPRAPGAPKKWDIVESLELISVISDARRAIAEKKGIPYKKTEVRDACRRVLKENPNRWPARGGGKLMPENLQKRYNEALNRTTAIQRLMYVPKKTGQ